jgi:hypothetical protein
MPDDENVMIYLVISVEYMNIDIQSISQGPLRTVYTVRHHIDGEVMGRWPGSVKGE